MSNIQLYAVLLAVTCAAAVHGDEAAVAGPAAAMPTVFARVAEDARGRAESLQVAIVTYVPRDEPARYSVDLVGAVHVGDKAYYAELNEKLRRYDALLFELITPEGDAAAPEETEDKNLLSGAQQLMKNALDLTFQLDEIDYDRPNFVHADLSQDELEQSMEDRGESIYVYFWRLVFASFSQMARDPFGLRELRRMGDVMAADQDFTLKVALAYELTRTEMLDDFLGDESGSAIIAARNDRALQVLREQLEAGAKRVGIFYGVAHLPDLEARLLSEFGLSQQATVWVDAWQLGASPPNAD